MPLLQSIGCFLPSVSPTLFFFFAFAPPGSSFVVFLISRRFGLRAVQSLGKVSRHPFFFPGSQRPSDPPPNRNRPLPVSTHFYGKESRYSAPPCRSRRRAGVQDGGPSICLDSLFTPRPPRSDRLSLYRSESGTPHHPPQTSNYSSSCLCASLHVLFNDKSSCSFQFSSLPPMFHLILPNIPSAGGTPALLSRLA